MPGLNTLGGVHVDEIPKGPELESRAVFITGCRDFSGGRGARIRAAPGTHRPQVEDHSGEAELSRRFPGLARSASEVHTSSDIPRTAESPEASAVFSSGIAHICASASQAWAAWVGSVESDVRRPSLTRVPPEFVCDLSFALPCAIQGQAIGIDR